MATSRRAALKSGLGLLAGAVGFGAMSKAADAAVLSGVTSTVTGVTIKTTTLSLRAIGVNVVLERPLGEALQVGDRMTTSADLVDAAGGKLGEFHSTATWLRVPGAVTPSAVSSLAQQTFYLSDGSIFGTGTVVPSLVDNTFAIVGGTGRYAGARGTYLARIAALNLGGDGTASFTLSLITEALNG